VSDVSRLFIELRFTMRQCTRYPDSSQIWRCKENIRLFHTEDDSPDVERYKVLDVIAADETFTDVTDSNVPVNVETRSIVVTSLKRVTFALLDEGSCVMLLSVKVYHYVCPQVITSLALFEDTPTGEIEGGVVTREGVCVANAKVTQLHGRPTFYCKADGHWYLLKGACVCDEGYQSTYDGTACLPVSGELSPVSCDFVTVLLFARLGVTDI
jgi:Eph receptor B1